MSMMRALSTAAMLVSAVATAAAHHSFSRYDSTKKVTLSGTLSGVRFQNPHVFFSLETGSGTVAVETESMPVLRGRGLNETLLKDGAKATVTGWRAKSGSSEIGLSSIAIGGKTFSVRRSTR